MSTKSLVKASSFAVMSLFCLDLAPYITAIPVVYTKSLLLLISALSLIFIKFKEKHKLKTDIIDQILMVYITMLFIRLFVDFVIKGQTFFVYSNTITVFVFTTGIILLPFMCFKSTLIRYNMNYIAIGLYVALFLCLILSVNSIFNGVVEATTSGRFGGMEGGVFSILFGHLGVSLIIISICINITSYPKIIKICLSTIGVFVGALCMIFSGSRGPFVAFVVVLVVYLILQINTLKRRYFVILILAVISLFLKSILKFINDFLQSIEITSFSRIYNSYISEDDVSSGRSWIFQGAWDDFLNNPVFGKAFLLDDASYVHNIFIEQFRALGFSGGIIFVIINLSMIIRGWKLIELNSRYSLFYLLFLQYLLFGCFSSCIITLPQYWIFLFVILNLYKQYAKSVSHNTHLQK